MRIDLFQPAAKRAQAHSVQALPRGDRGINLPRVAFEVMTPSGDGRHVPWDPPCFSLLWPRGDGSSVQGRGQAL